MAVSYRDPNDTRAAQQQYQTMQDLGMAKTAGGLYQLGSKLSGNGSSMGVGGALDAIGLYQGLQQGGTMGDLQAGVSAAKLGGVAVSALNSAGVATGAVGDVLQGVAGAAGYVAAPLAVYEAITQFKPGQTGGDTLRGAEAGAAIGSLIVPGIGTVIGGVIGGVAGAVSSLFGGTDKTKRSWDQLVTGQDTANAAKDPNDLISALGGLERNPDTKFPGDMDFHGDGNAFSGALTNQVAKAISSGQVPKNASAQQIYQQVALPWLQSLPGGWKPGKDQGAVNRAETNLVTDLISNYQQGKPTTSFQLAGQQVPSSDQSPAYSSLTAPPPPQSPDPRRTAQSTQGMMGQGQVVSGDMIQMGGSMGSANPFGPGFGYSASPGQNGLGMNPAFNDPGMMQTGLYNPPQISPGMPTAMNQPAGGASDPNAGNLSQFMNGIGSIAAPILGGMAANNQGGMQTNAYTTAGNAANSGNQFGFSGMGGMGGQFSNGQLNMSPGAMGGPASMFNNFANNQGGMANMYGQGGVPGNVTQGFNQFNNQIGQGMGYANAGAGASLGMMGMGQNMLTGANSNYNSAYNTALNSGLAALNPQIQQQSNALLNSNFEKGMSGTSGGALQTQALQNSFNTANLNVQNQAVGQGLNAFNSTMNAGMGMFNSGAGQLGNFNNQGANFGQMGMQGAMGYNMFSPQLAGMYQGNANMGVQGMGGINNMMLGNFQAGLGAITNQGNQMNRGAMTQVGGANAYNGGLAGYAGGVLGSPGSMNNLLGGAQQLFGGLTGMFGGGNGSPDTSGFTGPGGPLSGDTTLGDMQQPTFDFSNIGGGGGADYTGMNTDNMGDYGF